MSKLSTFVMMLICLLLGVLIGYSAKTLAVIREENKDTAAYQKYPRRTIVVKIETTQQEKLFDVMRKFADDQGFAIRIASTSPSGANFIVEMWREDTKIIALNSFDPGTFSIDFFDTDSAIKSPEWALNSLVSDFKSYINEVPNVAVTEEK
jgi:hypothetical protein